VVKWPKSDAVCDWFPNENAEQEMGR